MIHLAGGMEGDHGEPMNFDTHGNAHMGGQWATVGMMNGGIGGMGGAHVHMATDRSHPNGSYGMLFTFIIAA